MTIYKFPSESGKNRDPKKEKKLPIHHPEFIHIEDLQENASIHESGEYTEMYSSVSELEKVHLPFLLRTFTLGISIALLFGSILLLLASTIAGIIALLTLTQINSINDLFQRYWRYCKRMFVTSLGLLIMCFSPALGMGFIGLYFALQGESVEGNFLERFFKHTH